MVWINILFISLLCVFVIDQSGFIREMENMLSRWLGVSARIPKPFSCSLCMAWWSSLIYVLIAAPSMANVMLCALFAWLTPVFQGIMTLIRESILTLIERNIL